MNFEYATAPESRSVVKIDPEYGHFINGNGLTDHHISTPLTRLLKRF